MGLELRRYIWPRFDGQQSITVYTKELNEFPKGYENKKAKGRSFKTIEGKTRTAPVQQNLKCSKG